MSAGSRVACSGATACAGLAHGGSTRVSWGFNSDARFISGWFAGPCGCQAGTFPRGGRVLSSLPDNGRPHAGAAARSWRSALSNSPHDRRFRRSDALYLPNAQVVAAAVLRRECRAGGATFHVGLVGDAPPIWWCTTRMRVQVPDVVFSAAERCAATERLRMPLARYPPSRADQHRLSAPPDPGQRRETNVCQPGRRAAMGDAIRPRR